MASAERPDPQGSLEDMLRNAEPPVRYDVEQGYARHQRLLASGASLPEWATEIPAQGKSSLLRKWGPWLGAGFMLGAVATWNMARPERRSEHTPDRATAEHQEANEAASDEHASPLGIARRTDGIGAPAVAAPELPPAEAPQLHGDLPPGTPVVEPIVQPLVAGASEGALPPTAANAAKTANPAVAGGPTQTAAEVAHTELGSGPRAAALVPAKQSAKAGSHGSAGTRASSGASAQGPMDREEIRQLAQAEQLLVNDPSAAVDLVRKGNVQFKRGYLQHERRYIEVMALFAAGRMNEGQARAQWFLRDYRTSPYREKVQHAAEQHSSH